MPKRIILAAAMLTQTALAQLGEPAPSPALGTKPPPLGSYESLKIGDRERLLVIAPHPDDETLGAAGLIQRVIECGGTVRVVLMTAGDAYVEVVSHETHKPKPTHADFVAFGERRIRESQAALRELGHDDRIRLQVLGFPDSGLDALLCSYWSSSKPYRSPTSGASDPPYDREALNPDIPYAGEGLRRELAGVIEDARPTLVALPDPLDNHPDHHAAGVFALLALNDWLSHPEVRFTGTGPHRAANPRLSRSLAALASRRKRRCAAVLPARRLSCARTPAGIAGDERSRAEE